MKTIFVLGIALLLGVASGCKGDSASTSSTSGSASAGTTVPADLGDPSDQQEAQDTADLTPDNAEAELGKLEQEVNAPY
jgi:hypothetical protein